MKLLSWLKEKVRGTGGDPWAGGMDIGRRQEELALLRVGTDLEENIRQIEQVTGNSADITVRRFRAGGTLPAALVYIDGMIDTRSIEEILRSLLPPSPEPGSASPARGVLRSIIEDLLVVDDIQEVERLDTLFHELADGKSALLVDGSNRALLCETQGEEMRGLQEPNAEQAIRGPRDGFIENVRTNTSLIRRRIRSPHLWIENMEIGDLTQTKVEIAYIKGLASEEILTELRGRLRRIRIDGILESGYIEEFIEDDPFTLFPLVLRTERTDKVASALLEGRVALFTSGTPHVLLLPAELPMMLQAPDDYYEKVPIGTLTRILRMISLVISLLLPGFYVAVINFHQELLPTTLLLRMTAAREGVPFPVIVEVLILEFLFEILREAGIRLPAAIGQAISIVGALILGDAAIRAGLVSPAVVIIIALTAIASFSTPLFSLSIAVRILRFIFTLLAAAFGLFGLQFGLLVLIIHLSSLRSFGVPYASPMAPLVPGDLKDSIIRYWWWGMRRRPEIAGRRDPVRQDSVRKPRGGKRGDEPEGG